MLNFAVQVVKALDRIGRVAQRTIVRAQLHCYFLDGRRIGVALPVGSTRPAFGPGCFRIKSHNTTEWRGLDRLDELIVRIATAAALAFFLALVVVSVLSRDAEMLLRSFSPAVIAAVGIWMLVRGSPRAIVQLVVGGVVFVVDVGFIDMQARAGALFGLLSMGIVGALIIRRHYVVFLTSTTLALAGVAYWWNVGGYAPPARVSESVAPALAYLFTAALVISLRISLERESAAHRQAAIALSASEERFRRAFEVAAAGVALVGVSDGRFLQVNQAGRDLLGYSEQELRRMTVRDVTHPYDWKENLERFRKVATGESLSSKATVRYVRSDGNTARAMISAALVTDSDGKPSHVVAHAVDTTELHAAQQRLADLVDSKDQLIAAVSHEIRTPLTAVLGYAELLRERLPDLPTGEQVEMIDDIVAQATALANIIDDLLVAARAETGELHVSREAVDLRAEAATVVETLGRQTQTGHIQLHGCGVYAMGDPARIRQILRNVISNALRYGGDSVQVVISVQADHCCVIVADDGPGIPDDQREVVFAAYERAEPQKGLTPAVGLGLTVARALARLMDGDLVYRYEHGRSLFDLSLPLVPGAAQPSTVDAASTESSG